MRHSAAAVCSLFALLCPLAGRAGHEAPFYPSFYPQEIRIETLAPAVAAAEWAKPRVHAYVGAELFGDGSPPARAASVTSLRSYLVLSFDAAYGPYAAGSGDAKSRCVVAGRILPRLAQQRAGYVFHPYPITPYHADYLAQYDLARRAQQRYAAPGAKGAAAKPRIRPKGPLAEALVPGDWKAGPADWDATLEEIDIRALVEAGHGGPADREPWSKQGWFQAHRLYAQPFPGHAAGLWAEHAYRRLIAGDYRSDVERINLERALVAMLGESCERVVVGYTLRREDFNADYSNGVEDVAFDSQAGLLSPIFPRSVKLKDFPWNGWLRIGLAGKPAAAWNPIGGFDDDFGRLFWLTVADPALLPAPYGGSWIGNRVSIDSAAATSSGVPVPEAALRPEEGTGILRPVGAGKLAQQRLRYSAVTSNFHDGTATEVADIVYPYIFAFRWGAGQGANENRDPVVARSTALVREWLAGFEVIGIETQTRNFGDDLKFSYRVPVVDVYLAHRSSDPWLAAAVAPPWSALPWELLVLMEEAVTRGVAAFSRSEAERRGIPWLDLVRDREVGTRLAALMEEFRRQGYRPESLRQLVTEKQARERWEALARFYAERGHLLVTNGPYLLASWTGESATLQVFRDPSYPLGVGTFDAYAIPLRAYVAAVRDRGSRIDLQADVERISTSQRSYEIERVALAKASEGAEIDDRPECRYVIVGPRGDVVRAGTAALDGGRFSIEVGRLGVPGRYTVAAALFIGGNMVDPDIKLIEHRVASTAAKRPRPDTVQ